MAFRSAVCRRFRAAALVTAMLSLLPTLASAAQRAETGFVRRVFHDEAGEHKYVVYVPNGYTPNRAWPVMLFLHGAGERGNDGFRHSQAALGQIIPRWRSFPWIVVFPQAEDTRGPIKTVWAADAPDGKRALAILDEVERTYRVDSSRRVLSGWSMGGRGAYMLAAAYPDRWSAVLPIAGWADLDLAPQLANVPLWSFHGTDDSLVPFDDDRTLIEAIRNAGGRPLFTALPNEAHYIWRSVYASPVVFEWLSDPSRFAGGEPPALNPLPQIELTLDEAYGPFIPGLELDNAVAIRIGPDLFRDLSDAAEAEISGQPLAGRIPGTTTETTEAHIRFKVQTSQMGYRVPVTEVEVAPTSQGTLKLHLAVADARLVIGRTDVRGGISCSATAGPMSVVLGHRQPIPVEVEAVPYVTENEFRLKTKSVSFTIPRGNWYVTRPVVDSHSLFLPARRVAESLVEGVYSSKPRIERDFRKSVADAVNELKLELPAVKNDQLLTALWPIPAYHPRIKPRLQSVIVDERGIAVMFGLTVAAIDPWTAPAKPRRVDLGLDFDTVGEGDLTVAAAEHLVVPLTTQLIEAGVAHVNVLDIPGEGYTHLARRDTLDDAIPAIRNLPPTAEIRTELYLRKPLGLGDTEEIEQVCTPDGCHSVFNLRVPDMTVVISVRDSREDDWSDYAEFSYDVTQPIRIGLGAEAEHGRELVSACVSSATTIATARWLTTPPADDRLDTRAATRLFEGGWASSTQACGPTTFLVPDVNLKGYVRRLERLEPGARGISAVFEEPETVLSNAADLPLVYRTRQGTAPWGPPVTLSPGERHPYRVSRPLGFEGETDGRTERYDVPPGRDATFRRLGDGRTGLVLDPLPSPPAPRPNLPGTGG